MSRVLITGANRGIGAACALAFAGIGARLALADLAAPDARYLVLVGGADQERALQTAEQVGLRLDRLVEQGVIGGYDTPTRFLPSQATQKARLASLPDTETLQARLQRALVDSPLSASKLGPFVADVQAARQAGPLHLK